MAPRPRSLIALTTSVVVVTAGVLVSVSGFLHHYCCPARITVLPNPVAPARSNTAAYIIGARLPVILSTKTMSKAMLSRTSSSSCLASASSSSFDEYSSCSSSSGSSSNCNDNNNINNDNNNLDPPLSSSSSDTQRSNNNHQGHRHRQSYPSLVKLPSNEEDEEEIIKNTHVSTMRQLRWEREAYILAKFAMGDELQELREEASRIRYELSSYMKKKKKKNIAADDSSRQTSTSSKDTLHPTNQQQEKHSSSIIQQWKQRLLDINERDAEFMYCVAKDMMLAAKKVGDTMSENKYRVQMKEAALAIPQFNMHGLWVGKYGDHGYEMINVTYSGETLIATKITGDRNVPKGEVTFMVDLLPQIQASSSSSSSSSLDGQHQQQQQQQYHHYVTNPLEPIVLDAKAQSQWSKKYLPRHVGKGRVASENFTNAQWVEGQFILVGHKFFSFLWMPLGQQIFFGRPSSELIMTMLKREEEEDLQKRDELERMRSVVKDMFEETYWMEKENNFFHDADDEEGEGCFE